VQKIEKCIEKFASKSSQQVEPNKQVVSKNVNDYVIFIFEFDVERIRNDGEFERGLAN